MSAAVRPAASAGRRQHAAVAAGPLRACAPRVCQGKGIRTVASAGWVAYSVPPSGGSGCWPTARGAGVRPGQSPAGWWQDLACSCGFSSVICDRPRCRCSRWQHGAATRAGIASNTLPVPGVARSGQYPGWGMPQRCSATRSGPSFFIHSANKPAGGKIHSGQLRDNYGQKCSSRNRPYAVYRRSRALRLSTGRRA